MAEEISPTEVLKTFSPRTKQNLKCSVKKDCPSSEIEEVLITLLRNCGGKLEIPQMELVSMLNTTNTVLNMALKLLRKKTIMKYEKTKLPNTRRNLVIKLTAFKLVQRKIDKTSTFEVIGKRGGRKTFHRQPITGVSRAFGLAVDKYRKPKPTPEEAEKQQEEEASLKEQTKVLEHRVKTMLKAGKIPPHVGKKILDAGHFTQHQVEVLRANRKLSVRQIEQLRENNLIGSKAYVKRGKYRNRKKREKAEFAEHMKQYAEQEGVDYVMIDIHAKKYEGFTKAEMRRLSVARGISKKKEEMVYKTIINEHKLAEKIPYEKELNRFIRDYENRVREYAYETSQHFTIFSGMKRKLTPEYDCLRKAFMLCKENGFDPANYLKAQFERFENFPQELKEKMKYPRPNILYSENAKKAMEIFNREHEIRENWEVDNDYGKYIHERKVGSLREELERELREVFDDFDLALKTRYKSIYRPRNWFIETVDDQYLHRENPDDFNRIVDAIYFSDYVHRAYGKVCPKLLATLEYTPEEFADADLIDSYKNNPDYYMVLMETVDKLRKEYASREKDPFYMPVKVMEWKKLDQLLQSKPAHLVKSIKQLREEQGEAMKREVLARIKAEEDAKLARRKNIIERARAQKAMEQQKCM